MERLNLNGKYDWMEKSIIALVPVGSYAYGTSIETSDVDYAAVSVPPETYYFGLGYFEELNNEKEGNPLGEVDVIVQSVSKYIKDVLKGRLIELEMLFTKKDEFLILEREFEEIMDIKHLFLSKHLYDLLKEQVEKKLRKTKKSLYIKDGKCQYDTKSFSDAIRILSTIIEVFRDGNIEVYKSNREILLDCRRGIYSFKEAMYMVDEYKREASIAYENTELSEKPDIDKINEVLIRVNKSRLIPKTKNN